MGVRRLLRLLFCNTDKRKTRLAKKMGVKIGNNCRFLSNPVTIFTTEPYLVTIGDDVTICNGVHFITHDGGLHVLRKKHPEIDLFQPISVGNNVFIGERTIILPGVKIGNNVIIGACSLVNKDIPDNSVWGGVPAHFISTISEYERKKMASRYIVLTKNIPEKDKKQFLSKQYPEWFENR